MRLLRRLEKRLAESRLLGAVDQQLSRRARPRDAVLVAGFWRSGTTFVMERVARMLRARSYFEPLHYRVARARPFHGGQRFEARGRSQGETCPYVRPDAISSPLDGFLADMLAGKISTPWTRKARGVHELFAPRVVVKLVRGNLLAAYLETKFSCRSVFVLRHPCGVAASLMRGQTNLSIYSSEAFLQLLLDQEELAGDYLLPHLDHVHRHRGSALGRLALAHAITNLVPLSQIAAGVYRPLQLSYERATLEPAGVFGEVASRLGGSDSRAAPEDPRRSDSLTTKREREGLAPLERCFGWKNDLSRAEIDTVYEVCRGFGPALTGAVEAIERLESYAPEST